MERWDIYDERAEKTGKIVNKGEALLPHEFHLAAEVWILNGKGQVLVQQRSCNCEILPGVWGLTTGRMRMAEDTRTGCEMCIRDRHRPKKERLPRLLRNGAAGAHRAGGLSLYQSKAGRL